VPNPEASPAVGSTPHTWGAHRSGHAEAVGERISPTGVRGSRPQLKCRDHRSDQPHRRGEHPLVLQIGRAAIGSAHGRGEHVPSWNSRTVIIGSAPPVWGTLHVILATLLALASGSAQRMWGTPGEGLTDRIPARLSPTCVGSTRRRACTSKPSPTQPHTGGEHASNMIPVVSVLGSAPRVRGGQQSRCGELALRRISPIRTGTHGHPAGSGLKRGLILAGRGARILPWFACKPEEIHPRSCGEHPPC
jgi:hypothetical protein